MESFIVLLAFVWVIKTAITDLPYTLRGQVPPRHRVALERLAVKQTRMARAGRPVRAGAATNYARVLWEHSWADLTDRHNRRRARRQVKPPRPPRTGPARAYFGAVTTDTRADLWRRWNKAWENAEARRRRRNEPSPDDAAWWWSDARAHDAPDAADAASGPAVAPTSHAETHTDSDELAAAPAVTPEPPAAVIGDGSNTENANQREATQMTSMLNLGEVSGLQSAIDFADKLAQASEESVQHLEQLGAGLTEGGTGNNTVGQFASAGDSLSAAASQLRAASDELRKHLMVRESYESTANQAGDKDFVLAD